MISQKLLNEKKKKKEKEFDDLFNKASKHTQKEITHRQKFFKWEKLKAPTSQGVYRIRCQAIKRLKEKDTQCNHATIKNKLFCRFHASMKVAGKSKIEKRIVQYQQFGILHNFNTKAFKKEFEEMRNMPKEEKEQLDSEIMVVLAFLRNVLSHYSDADIRARPSLLVGRDGIISRLTELKKAQHDIIYSPKVVFPLERVEALFLKFKAVILEEVKDKEILQRIADKFKLIGIEDREKHSKG